MSTTSTITRQRRPSAPGEILHVQVALPHVRDLVAARGDLGVHQGRGRSVAAQFLQAAYSADHIYGERLEKGLEEYRRMIASEEQSC